MSTKSTMISFFRTGITKNHLFGVSFLATRKHWYSRVIA